MKGFTLLFVFIILILSAKAQDKIISINQDTICCNIVSISTDRILYELKDNDGSVTGRFIPLSQVASYTCNHPLRENPEYLQEDALRPPGKPENPFSLGLTTGFATMPWYLDFFESSSATPEYFKKMKTGFQINASAHYLIRSYFGVGAEYSFFNTKASGNNQIEYPSSIYIAEPETCRQYVNYLGASVLFQQVPDAKQKFIFRESFSAGVLFLRLEDQIRYPDVTDSGYTEVTSNMLLTGETFCMKMGLSAGYRLSDVLSVGAGGAYAYSLLKKGDIETKESNGNNSSADNQKLYRPMKLTRFDYSVVVYYNF